MSELSDADKKARDRADLQNEIAGRDVGRQRRFLAAEDDQRSGPSSERRGAETVRAWTMLQTLMMNDPAYAALYNDVSRDVAGMEMAVHKAGMKAEREAMAAAADLGAIRARAGTLPDGTRVYRSETGHIFREDGSRLAPGAEEDVTWQSDPPSWEDYKAAKERSDAAAEDLRAIEEYQRDVLQSARDRLEDADDPPRKEELEQIQRQIREGAPESVLSELGSDDPAPTPGRTSAAAVPNLGTP